MKYFGLGKFLDRCLYQFLNAFFIVLRSSYYYYYYNTDEAFIGLTDLTLEGQWAWDDGSVTNYLNFDAANNEPNNWHGMEDCVTIKSSNGTWNDRACNLKRRYVCKKNNGKCFFVKKTF